MVAATPLSDEERERVRELHGQGWSRARIARELRRSPDTVGRVATSLGLSWDRTATAKATIAARIDAAARRAELASGLLDDAFRLRAELFAPCVVYDFTKDGRFVKGHLEQPPMSDQRHAMAAIAQAVDRHLALIRADADRSSGAEIDAWLDAMMAGQ